MRRRTSISGRHVALLCVFVAVLLAPLFAQNGALQPNVADWHLFHKNNDAYWAQLLTATAGWDPIDHSKISVSATDVRKIRVAAGIGDDEPSDAILEMEGTRMQPNEYLMLTAKSGGCLRAAVYAKKFIQFAEIWSSDSLANGAGICQQPGCPKSSVTVDMKHRINVTTYSRSTPNSPACDMDSTAVFQPIGNTFDLLERKSSEAGCWAGYGSGLKDALWKAAGQAGTKAIVRVSPSMRRGYAFALTNDGAGARVLQLEWPETDSPFTESLSKETASECFSRAAALHVKVTDLMVQQGRAGELAAALNSIDFRADRCVRNAEGECTRFLDGTYFQVEVLGHPAIELFDLQHHKGYVSQNPELSEWVYRLVDEAKQSKKMAAN
jgi:hypothetical protein